MLDQQDEEKSKPTVAIPHPDAPGKVDTSAARNPVVQKSELRFPVVGIGASAGGIAALKALLEPMAADTGMAFVVAVHLSPTHQSSMASILQRCTTMPVLEVTEPVSLQADHVYVISPSMQLLMTDGMLRVSPLDRRTGPHTAIDLMFRSLAEAHGRRAICMVLSGTGADGTQGLAQVKEAGGVTIAQQPDDAQYGDMPRSAIATGLVDIVLPAADIAERLLALWRNAQKLELPEPPASLAALIAPNDLNGPHSAEQALRGIILLLRERTGVDFAHYKPATVLRRLERRVQINGLPNLPAYRELLEARPAETAPLLQDMLISVTRFFRDPQAFEALEAELRARPFDAAATPALRAWIAGCATGEEAYSVAIVLREVLGATTQAQLQIFASDLDHRAIEVARRGHYAASIDLDVTPQRLQDHFERGAHGFQVGKAIREPILFAVHNVLRDPPFTRVDLICCRNLLIYLDRQAQAELLRAFHFALNPGGILFLGNSESVDAVDDLFSPIDLKHRIYRANRVSEHKTYLGPVAPLRSLALRDVQRAPPPSPRQPLELLHERAVATAGLPSVLLNAEHHLLHVGERAARFFRFVGGVPSNRVLEVLRPELRVELRTALFRAVESDMVVESRRVRLPAGNAATDVADGRAGEAAIDVSMSVRPFDDGRATGMLLVIFHEHKLSLDATGDTLANDGDLVTAALEDELVHAKEQLRQVVVDAISSTEELRAANEELQSMNEELRSATEELEASREELQSVNEELTGVNAEQGRKVEETGRINDDLTNLIAATKIGTIFVDRALCVKRYTPHATQIFNLIPSDIGRPLLHITHRLHYDEIEQDATAVLRSLSTIERELATHDEQVYLARLLPYRTAEDRIDGVVLNFIDITARSRAEAKVQLSEQHMRMVAGSMHDYAIVTFDLQGMITTWNSGAEAMFGHRADEVLGRSVEIIFTEQDRQAGAVEHEIRLARETGKADDDRWLVRKDGSLFFASGVTTALGAGNHQGYAKIARDITSNKLTEVRREAVLVEEQAHRSRIEEASALKDEFLAVMSHELKNPLNLIQLNAELLLRNPQARDIASVARAAGTIRQAVVSQAQIIDDLLDLSRLDSGKLAMVPMALDMNEVIQRTVAAIAVDASTKQQSIHLDLQPAVTAFADPVRVEQIVWNLLTNALKFTPPQGRITLELTMEATMARISVTDTGIGLAAHECEPVFEMFHQVDGGTNRDKGGLGIGLALVKRIALLHGGRVEAKSPGLSMGSTFSVWLPSDEKAATPGLTEVPTGDLRGQRILMVDDEPATLDAFAELLGMEGAEVSAAASAAEALQHLQHRSFDLLVSDLAMPTMDGYELIALVRANPATQALPAIAVSGMGRASDMRRALQAGFDAHLSKPVQLAQLVAAISKLQRLPVEPEKM